ncbi:sensor histidine kinase [Hyphococcus luteus]|uniref:histidine kinase n=1 Tax=Hyphococcus luteus TaxID=2058213 RepID=A0A2S7K2V8_9PROT|nr:ATP-binding protein [Marinicaulis flavus]PQA86840.1 hypothetical protein CW354_15280 [Marinicaulis flavus]
MRKTSSAGASASPSIIDQHRDAIFYLVLAVFFAMGVLQNTLPILFAPGLTGARIAGYATLACFAAIFAFFHFTKKLEAAAIALLTATYLGLGWAALNQGGGPATALIYIPFLPMVATVLLGRRAGIISAAISIIMMTVYTAANVNGYTTPTPHTPHQMSLLYASGAILLTIGVAMHAVIYEHLVKNAMNAAQKAQRELQEKADELAENREFLSTVMDSINEGIVAADANGKLSVFNKQARAMHGLDAMPLASSAWPQTYSLYDADGETLLAEKDVPLFRALNGEKVSGQHLAIVAQDKPKRFFCSNAAPMRNAKGERIGAVATMRDITRERVQEEKISRQNREIDQFARVASVDLQEPLKRIVATADTLRDAPEVKDSGRMRNELASISSAAKRMGALIKDVLYMSRLPIGEMSLQPVAARECIEAAIDLLDINEANCRLDFRFAGSPEIVADPHSLTLVFKHLIENAWRHAPEGVKPHVEFTWIVEDGAAVLGVKDNGAGLTKEEAERVFLPLERVRTSENEEGSGLGLAICRKSLTRMGGEFWLETEPGEGCHFRLRLPLAEAKAMAS